MENTGKRGWESREGPRTASSSHDVRRQMGKIQVRGAGECIHLSRTSSTHTTSHCATWQNDAKKTGRSSMPPLTDSYRAGIYRFSELMTDTGAAGRMLRKTRPPSPTVNAVGGSEWPRLTVADSRPFTHLSIHLINQSLMRKGF